MPFLSELFNNDVEALFEAINYNDMFRDFLGKMDKDSREHDLFTNKVNEMIRSAKEHLKTVTTTPEGRDIVKPAKEDRMVWFLRLAKLTLAHEYAEQVQTPEASQYAEKIAKDYERKSGRKVDVYNSRYMQRLLTNIEHYLSLPIASIRNYVFKYEDPEELLLKFQEYEKEWQAEGKGAFEDDEAKPIIKFPNGLAWYDLGKAYCPKEADAMGHCGNKPGRYRNETILSLRAKVQRGTKTLYKPYLTFILDNNGMLGEMKGRFNNKPEEKFHDEIVALLRNPMVQGIKGGGYLSHNNFSLNDLPDDVREKLQDEKPELGSLWDAYIKFGAKDPRFQAKFEAAADAARFEYEKIEFGDDNDSGYVVLTSFRDLGGFLNEVDDKDAKMVYDIYEGDITDLEEFIDVEGLDQEELYDLIDGLDIPQYQSLMKRLGLEPVSHNSDKYRRAVLNAASKMRRDEGLMDDLRDSINISKEQEQKAQAAAAEIMKEFIDCGWAFETFGVDVVTDKEKPLDGPVEIVVSLRDVVAGLDDEESDEYYTIRDIGDNAHLRLSDDSMEEMRNRDELPYAARRGYSTWKRNNKEDEVDYKEKLMHRLLDTTGINFRNFSAGFARQARLS